MLRWAEYPRDRSPEDDHRAPIWEALHHLTRALAYRRYTLREHKGWAKDARARAYNKLVTAWSDIECASVDAGVIGSQSELDL